MRLALKGDHEGGKRGADEHVNRDGIILPDGAPGARRDA